MRVLTSPDGSAVLTFPIEGNRLVGTDRKHYAKGKVADLPDAQVSRAFSAALTARVNDDGAIPFDPDDPFAFVEMRDITRDLKWINRALVDVKVGASVGMVVKGRGVSLDIPKSALPTVVEPRVGDVIAVGHNITPKALMNARGVVQSVNGTRLTAVLTEGDRKRIERATGKKFGATVRLPKASVEVDAECLVEVSA